MSNLIEPGDTGRSRWSLLGRTLAVTLLIGFAVFWIYAFSGLPDNTHPDRLEDRAFAIAAEERCAAVAAQAESTAAARDAADLADRAAQIDAATQRLETMIDDLAALPVPDGDDGRIVREWLADWRVYNQDRREHAELLRAGEDPPFAVTDKQGDQITLPIDVFADVNDMLSCATPHDV